AACPLLLSIEAAVRIVGLRRLRRRRCAGDEGRQTIDAVVLSVLSIGRRLRGGGLPPVCLFPLRIELSVTRKNGLRIARAERGLLLAIADDGRTDVFLALVVHVLAWIRGSAVRSEEGLVRSELLLSRS